MLSGGGGVGSVDGVSIGGRGPLSHCKRPELGRPCCPPGPWAAARASWTQAVFGEGRTENSNALPRSKHTCWRQRCPGWGILVQAAGGGGRSGLRSCGHLPCDRHICIFPAAALARHLFRQTQVEENSVTARPPPLSAWQLGVRSAGSPPPIKHRAREAGTAAPRAPRLPLVCRPMASGAPGTQGYGAGKPLAEA